MIIGFINQKGGVGKTTLSINVAHDLAQRKNKVLLVDADPQQSAINWTSLRDKNLSAPFPVISLPQKTLHRDIPDLAKDYDHVVIDGAPRKTDIARSCIIVSDFIVLPVTPSPFDIWATHDMLKIIEESKTYKPHIKYALAINLKRFNTRIGKDVLDTIKELEVPVLNTHIIQRVIFQETASHGNTVFDEDYNIALTEIQKLTSEILNGGV